MQIEHREARIEYFEEMLSCSLQYWSEYDTDPEARKTYRMIYHISVSQID
jgi:hypothetical protein